MCLNCSKKYCFNMENSSSFHEMNSENINTIENSSEAIYSKNVYLSVTWFSGCLGAAYYDADNATLSFLMETVEVPPFNVLFNLVNELTPIVVITSARQDAEFLKALQSCKNESSLFSVANNFTSETGSEKAREVSSVLNEFSLELLSSIEFDYQSSKHRLLSVEVPGIPQHYTSVERAMHLSSCIPLDNISSVRAAGGLLRYLEKKRIGVELESPTVATPILSFQIYSLKNTIFVDKDSYKALQVFSSVSHPSAYKVSTREGLSLFGILNQTITNHGNKLLKTWFFRPTYDRNILKRRLDAVSFFVNRKNEEVVHAIKEPLKHIKNVTKIIIKIKTSKLNVMDWINVLQTAQNALRIADVCHGIINMIDNENIPLIFKDVIEFFGCNLGGVAAMITKYMDVNSSKLNNRFVVLPGVSAVVDDMKAVYAQLPSLLDQIAQQEIETYKDYLSVCQIVYMRRIGYLLFVDKDVVSKIADDSFSIPGMTFVAATNKTIFYKTPATEKLDEKYGDLLENIAYHEIEIMSQLQNKLLEHSSIFVDVMKYTAELDCLMSFAAVAKNYNYVRPNFTDNNEINVIGSRHPMQEHIVSLFVPNNISFESNKFSIKILTGPNASGKSVYLKQVGLIAFMAHIGSFVPAENVTIGRVSSIFTVIRTSESLSNQLSSFGSALQRMATAVQNSDEHSLILIDEFGKGTATLDGIALLTSCLKHFIDREKPPRVLCATHFHSITQRNLITATDMVQFLAMDTIPNSETDTAYLYQLINGVTNQSCASAVARTAGLPKEIVDRGREISKIMQRQAPIYKFNRSSALTYQFRCNEVAAFASQHKLTDGFSLKQLLCDVTYRFREKASEQTDSSSIDVG